MCQGWEGQLRVELQSNDKRFSVLVLMRHTPYNYPVCHFALAFVVRGLMAVSAMHEKCEAEVRRCEILRADASKATTFSKSRKPSSVMLYTYAPAYGWGYIYMNEMLVENTMKIGSKGPYPSPQKHCARDAVFLTQ